MTNYNLRKAITRSFEIATAVVLGLVLVVGVWPGANVHASANEISSRSLTTTSSANGTTDTSIGGTPESAGQGGNGEKTGETFQFTIPVGSNVGSMAFIYCDGPLPGTACNPVTGLTTANVTASPTVKINGTPDANYSIDTSTSTSTFNTDSGLTNAAGGGCTASSNCIFVKRSSAAAESANATFNIQFSATSSNYITNPTGDNTTFFVRILVFSDTGYTTAVDQGSVANSTAQQVDVTAKVQETLNFSVGTFSNGSDTPNGPNAPGSSCTALGGTGESSGLTLGDTNGVLSATQAYNAHSYFRLSTNAFNGVAVQYSGDTLHSGSTTIAAIGATAAASNPGNPQFGITIDSGDTQGGNGYSFTNLVASTQYASPTAWAFDTGSVSTPVTIASAPSIVACETGSVSYLGNIAYSTPAGIYTTDISYLVVPTY